LFVRSAPRSLSKLGVDVLHMSSNTKPNPSTSTPNHEPWSPFMIGVLADPGDVAGAVYTMDADDLETAIAEAERKWVPKLVPGARIEVHAGQPSWRADSRRIKVAWELNAEGEVVRDDNPR
jgi:hypothetical protein